MLPDEDCIRLRDLLFENRLPTKEPRFRYLAVQPAGTGDDVIVHFAYIPAAWRRAGKNGSLSDAFAYLEGRIDGTPYHGLKIELRFYEYLEAGWPVDWAITAKHNWNNSPLLVLYEGKDGSVRGALMRDSHQGNVGAQVAGEYAEPAEAAGFVDKKLVPLAPYAPYKSWYKESNIDANSLEAAIAMTPESQDGKKGILLYRQMEWLRGTWTNPAIDPSQLVLTSIADFHGTRVSVAKRSLRAGLEAAVEKQTIPGDYELLESAVALLTGLEKEWPDFEQVPPVKSLCAWWNNHAPEDMRTAAYFRVYVWDEQNLAFEPGDPQEPSIQANELARSPCYAVFSAEGKPTVALQFYRGRTFNRPDGHGGTRIFYADGSSAAQIGASLSEVNDAYFTLSGLESLASSLEAMPAEVS